MIKANATKPKVGALEISQDDMEVIAEYLAKAGDTERRRKEERRESVRDNIQSDERGIERYEENIREYQSNIETNERELDTIEDEIANLPPMRTVSQEEAKADIQRALALPFIESIAVEEIGGDRIKYIVATTREGALSTTLARKFSRSEKWYRAKPYKIALPQYKIRIGTSLRNNITQNSSALGLALANPQDTEHFLEWIGRYRHDAHAHWGTPSGDNEYQGVCLGEFEFEVSKAVRTSIADALVALSIYLQTAGARSAYVHKREEWALFLGKKAYNFALVPSEKEVATLTEAESDDDEDEQDEIERYNAEGDRDDGGDYDVNGDLI
jgi:hypothetical protein